MADADIEEGVHPTGRMSARLPRMELISRRERHRRWTVEQKREIVAEMLTPGVRATDLARKYEITTGQLYTWRRLLRDGKLDELPVPAPSFVRVGVVAVPRAAEGATSETPAAPRVAEPTCKLATGGWRHGGVIEIELVCGTRIRVDADITHEALGRVLRALGRQ